jgi:hypothetical protein
VISGNLIDGDVNHRAVEGYLYCHDFLMEENIIHNHSSLSGVGAVHFEGGVGLGARDITIRGNHIYQHVPGRHGIAFRGDVDGITIADNPVIQGTAAIDPVTGLELPPTGIGVMVDLTAGHGRPHTDMVIAGNGIRKFGSGVIMGTPDGTTPYEGTAIKDNRFADTPTAVHLNTESGTLPGHLHLMIAGNQYGRGVNARLVNAGTRQKYWATGEATFACYGSPEGLIAAPVGCEATDWNSGTVYRKANGTGATGWVTP